MQSCVFVDGENLRHSLCDLFTPAEFDPAEYLPKKANWEGFFDFLSDGCSSTRLRTYWYVVQHLEFWPWKLPMNDSALLKQILSKHQPFSDQIRDAQDSEETARSLALTLQEDRTRIEKRFRGWETVQNGIAGSHDATEFRRAGTIRYDLFKRSLGAEKAVDVKLAVDMLELGDIYDMAIVVSGDGDYVPVVQAAKNRGKRVVNVSFQARNGKLLPGGARRLNQITDRILSVRYSDMKRFMLPTS